MIIALTLFSYNSETEKRLSDVLVKDYMNVIKGYQSGKKILKELHRINRKPEVYLDYYKDGWLAWYESDGRIFFNLKYLMIFFNIEDYDRKKIIDVMINSEMVRKEFVNYTDYLFVHELIHFIQDVKYTHMTALRQEFAEFEYEAFIKTDLYFYEKMKKNKKLFRDLLSGKYYDLYSGYAMGGFISSFDVYEDYLKAIEKRYLDEAAGYVKLSDEEKKRKILLEERRIISYVSGKKTFYERSKKDYEILKKNMALYIKNVGVDLKKIWDKYSDEASFFTLDFSYLEQNYSVFFRVLYFVYNVKKKYYDEKKVKNMKEGFIKFLEKNVNSVSLEDIYWFEKNFNEDITLESLRHKIYPEILKKELKKCNVSEDKKCTEMIDFISEILDGSNMIK